MAHGERSADFPPVFVHIVTYNSSSTIIPCLESLAAQNGYDLGKNLQLAVTDNASSDGTAQIISGAFKSKSSVSINESNLGFCAGHNYGARRFLESDCRFLLILNPDCALAPDALARLVTRLDQGAELGLATPKLLRADASLRGLDPPVIDACGMELTSAVRHLDRGSSQLDQGQYDEPEEVFGGTGACLLIRRDCLADLILAGLSREADIDKLYPELEAGRSEREMLFDEAFFAFREDADLCWRAKLLGWKCIYEPTAIGYHQRFVLPERRKDLPKIVNLWGVRNRFLLQLNNYFLSCNPGAFLQGIIVRNLMVLIATVLFERSSLPAFSQLYSLLPRALERRAKLRAKIRERADLIA